MAPVRSVNSRHDQSSTKILNYMSDANETTFGFVFYRCCSYDNDARWSDFMIRMNAWAIWGLEGEADGIAIRDRLSLETVEDPTLVGASKEDIRIRHREWVNSSGQAQSHGMNSRHHYPICVDQGSLDSVLNASEPGTITEDDITNEIVFPTSYVIMISMLWELPTATEDDVTNGIDPTDEGCPPIDGCKMEDVGWMKVKPFDLIPTAYSAMMDYGWEDCYRRPPQLACISI